MPIVKQPLPAFTGTIAQPDPFWVTPAGVVSGVDPDTEISVQLEATDPFNGSIIYTLKSGVLPGFQESFGTMKFLLHADEPESSLVTVNSVTSFGVPLQGTMTITNTESKFGIGSIDNQNKEGYINFGTPASLGIVSSDFSIHGWFNRKSNPTGIYELFSNQEKPSNRIAIKVYLDGTSTPVFQLVSSNFTNYFITGLQPAPLNTWVHIALVRQGITMYAFADGILQGTRVMSSSDLRADANGDLFLCASGELGQPVGSLNFNRFNGRVDEFVIEREARWTANFTPPTEPFGDPAASGPTDPDFADVALLMNYDGQLDGSTTFIDHSNNSHTFSLTGTPTISTSTFKLGEGSIDLSGGAYDINTPDDASLHLLANQFTIECFAQWSSAAAGSQVMISQWGNGLTNLQFTMGYEAPNFSFRSSDGSDFPAINTAFVPVVGTWYHFAITRDINDDVRMFIDGVQGTSISYTGRTLQATVNILRIGSDGVGRHFPGFIDSVRITNGTARYIANFTPPTAPLPTLPGAAQDPNFNDVILQLSMEGIANTNTFTDDSNLALVPTTFGNAKINNTEVKFGNTSMEILNDLSARLLYSDANLDRFTATSMTYEGWFYSISNANWRTIFSANGFTVYVNGSGGFRWWWGNQVIVSSSGIFTTNVWHHVAVVMESHSVIKLYLDGVQVLSRGNAPVTSTDLMIGAHINGSLYPWNGYMDDIRITRNVARYTATFTPPGPIEPVVIIPTVPGVSLGNDGLLSGNVGEYLGVSGSDLHDFTVTATSNFTNISTDRDFNITVFDTTLNTDWESLWAGSSVQHTIASPTSAQFEAATPNNVWLSWPNP